MFSMQQQWVLAIGSVFDEGGEPNAEGTTGCSIGAVLEVMRLSGSSRGSFDDGTQQWEKGPWESELEKVR